MRDVPRETSGVERQMRDLASCCSEMGLGLGEEQLAMFSTYLEELLVWNNRVNLVSRRFTDRIAVNHFVDCLSLLVHVPLPAKAALMDIGSGAGLPGIPLKIMRKDTSLVLVEATQKKALFLKHVTGLLGLSATQVLCSRAEDLHGQSSLRSCFDVVVARAVTNLKDLVVLSLPFLKQGSLLVAFKGGDVSGEMAAAQPILQDIHGVVMTMKEIEIVLPISHKRRRFVLFTRL